VAAPALLGSARRTLLNPLDVGRLATQGAGRIPDPIEFVMSDRYIGKPSLYPRQGTLMKVIFLREDMFTQYDYDVVGEWEQTFMRTGNEGISPGILDRMRSNKAQGRKWFREVLAAIGRRGGKGHTGGLSGAYIAWNYMNVPGGPHSYYGIDPDKQLAAIVFAGKKEQAVALQWADLVNAITSSNCFQPYISKNQGEKLTLYTPQDLLKIQQQQLDGIKVEKDQASIAILPSGNTAMAGRGPAAFMEFFDEMAHIVKVGAGQDAAGIYNCLHPDTRVLTADMVWKRIDDLEVGEELVGVDEHRSGLHGTPRKLRRATVEAKWDTHQTAYRVEFEDGTSVVCSGNHRWLASSAAGKDWRWASVVRQPRTGSAGNSTPLRVGDKIKAFGDPWEQEVTYEAGYLAGMFDGEGSVYASDRNGLNVTFTQRPGAVLDRVLRLLEERGLNPKHYGVTTNGCVNVRINRPEDVFRLFGTLEMHRLSIDGLWEGMALRNGRAKTITAITEIEQQRLVDIQTSTGTFVAEGLVSHNSATPALDQFGLDGFVYAGSSPWQMMGQFYDLTRLAIEMEHGKPVYPERLLVQLPSWGPYEDWKIAHTIGLAPSKKTYIDVKDSSGQIRVVEREITGRRYPRVKTPIQTFDDEMKKLERANPDTFKVERRSHWAASLIAYLNMAKVQAMFKPFRGETLMMNKQGPLSIYYAAHGDPAKINDNFGFAIAHTVPPDPAKGEDPQFPHVVFDVIKSWRAEDFEVDEDGVRKIDYTIVQEQIENYIQKFKIDHLTFDQFNSVQIIGNLNAFVREKGFPKRIQVYERTATKQTNWREAEVFKAALNMNLLHAPALDPDGNPSRDADLAELELTFLEEKNGKVDHPSSGPVQTKDIADAMMAVTYHLIGDQIGAYINQALDEASRTLGTSAPAAVGTPTVGQRQAPADDPAQQLAALGQSMGAMVNTGSAPARGRGMRRR